MIESIRYLTKNGQFIFITPRSYTSGIYFKLIREYLLSNLDINLFHLFVSRNSLFSSENVLQENIITCARKNKIQAEKISIIVSKDINTSYTQFKADSNIILSNEEERYLIKIPCDKADIETLKQFKKWKYRLKDFNYVVSTGPVVPFRHTKYIGSYSKKYAVPIIYMKNIKYKYLTNQDIEEGINKQTAPNNLYVNAKNFIVLKRFSAKEQKNKICASIIYKDLFNAPYVSFENHVNYIYKKNKEMEKEEAAGLYDFITSKIVNDYFRIINGTTQININDLENLPIPNDLKNNKVDGFINFEG